MDLLFLGTSAGAPTRRRNVSGVALLEDSGKGWYLVDCGEGTQHQLLRTSLSLHALRAIFITHVHGDHCYGLPGLLASAGLSGRKAPLAIIGPAPIERYVRTVLEVTETYLPYELTFQTVESGSEWSSPLWRVKAIELSHRVPSYAYRFSERRPSPRLDTARLDADGIPRGPLWGALMRGEDQRLGERLVRSDDYLLFGHRPRQLIVAGDNDEPERLREASVGTQLLIHEATYTESLIAARGGVTNGHSSAKRVARFATEAGIPNLVLTHFSPRYQDDPSRSPNLGELQDEAAAGYEGTLILAKDFMRLRLTQDGSVDLRL